MILPIITEPNPILRLKAKNLSSSELSRAKLAEFINNLVETMYASDGVGIAAPQTGESIQLCVIGKNYTEKKDGDLILINPEWRKMSLKCAWGEEGCLSVPGKYGKVKRYKKIRVKAMNRAGAPVEFIAEDFFARVIQHEIDHLNGTLFIDKAKDIYSNDQKL